METWVSDSLYNILGISESTTVDFIIEMGNFEKFISSLGKRAKDLNSIQEQLLNFDFPDSEKTTQFAKKLYEKLTPQSVPVINVCQILILLF